MAATFVIANANPGDRALISQPADFFRQAALRIARHSLQQVLSCRDALPETVRST